MSNPYIHLPELTRLKESLEVNPSLIDYYSKYDAWIGPSDSVKFLDKMINEAS